MWGMYLCISPEKTTTNSTRLAITCFSLNRLNASSRLEHSLNSLDTSSTTASLGVTKVCSRWGWRHTASISTDLPRPKAANCLDSQGNVNPTLSQYSVANSSSGQRAVCLNSHTCGCVSTCGSGNQVRREAASLGVGSETISSLTSLTTALRS